MAGPGQQAGGFHSGGRLGRESRPSERNGVPTNTTTRIQPSPFGLGFSVPANDPSLNSNKPSLSKSAPTPFSSSKRTNTGGKPGEDGIAKSQSLLSNLPATDLDKALIEARRQRAQLATGVQIAAAIAPSVIGPGLTVGNWMGKQAEDDATANPARFDAIGPQDPGGIKSKYGPLTSNRALSGPAAKTTTAGGDTVVKKKKEVLPTLLGASANPLGTFSNPVMIT